MSRRTREQRDVAVCVAFALVMAMMTLGGCAGPASTAHDLLAADAISAAAGQAMVGVTALDAAMTESDRLRAEAMMADLRASILIVAGVGDGATSRPDSEQTADMADRIVAAMRTHQANYREQDRRRRELVAATLDNLDYVVEVAEASRRFALARGDISAQWRSYIEAIRRPATPDLSGAGAVDGGGAVGVGSVLQERIDACPFMTAAEKANLTALLAKLNLGG